MTEQQSKLYDEILNVIIDFHHKAKKIDGYNTTYYHIGGIELGSKIHEDDAYNVALVVGIQVDTDFGETYQSLETGEILEYGENNEDDSRIEMGDFYDIEEAQKEEINDLTKELENTLAEKFGMTDVNPFCCCYLHNIDLDDPDSDVDTSDWKDDDTRWGHAGFGYFMFKDWNHEHRASKVN